MWPTFASNAIQKKNGHNYNKYKILQHETNAASLRPIGRRARLMAWLPLLAVQAQVLSPAP